MTNPDILIIGAGIIGLSIAREIQNRYPGTRVLIIDKENGPGRHASGRNSGVLHSGIYYTADSLKARFASSGNMAWRDFCRDRGLKIDQCGKLIVPRNQSELQLIPVLEQRGRSAGIEIHLVDAKQARDLESRVKVFEKALYIPSTATIDPVQLIQSLESEFLKSGGTIKYKNPFIYRKNENAVATPGGLISAGFIVNCAGLHADKIAYTFGFGGNYAILPFKGLYLYANPDSQMPKTHIYPVPDLKNPFLGVHFTRTIDGHTKVGPTAVPAFWREHYQGLQGFKWDEFIQILGHEAKLAFSNGNGFRRLAWQEFLKQWQNRLVKDAQTLFNEARKMGFQRWGRPGIRAQLLDKTTGALEMDFVIKGDEKSIHVLNAVSPALTCALPFAKHVVDRIVCPGNGN